MVTFVGPDAGQSSLYSATGRWTQGDRPQYVARTQHMREREGGGLGNSGIGSQKFSFDRRAGDQQAVCRLSEFSPTGFVLSTAIY